MYLELSGLDETPKRKRMRLGICDYSREGPYFVTICVANMECLFGKVDGGVVHLSEAGQMTRETWLGVLESFPTVAPDEFVIMPNHFHGILGFVGAGLAPPGFSTSALDPPNSKPLTLSDVIRVFKSISTRKINARSGFAGRGLWQRSFYDRVLRDGDELRHAQRYILENPARWGAKRQPDRRELADRPRSC
jgi:REP element-mobilizing transposase RayT